jgi:hypothetical protein
LTLAKIADTPRRVNVNRPGVARGESSHIRAGQLLRRADPAAGSHRSARAHEVQSRSHPVRPVPPAQSDRRARAAGLRSPFRLRHSRRNPGHSRYPARVRASRVPPSPPSLVTRALVSPVRRAAGRASPAVFEKCRKDGHDRPAMHGARAAPLRPARYSCLGPGVPPGRSARAATERLLAPIVARVRAGRLAAAAEIGVAVGKMINKYNTGKHFEVTITDTSANATGMEKSRGSPAWAISGASASAAANVTAAGPRFSTSAWRQLSRRQAALSAVVPEAAVPVRTPGRRLAGHPRPAVRERYRPYRGRVRPTCRGAALRV